MKYLVFFIQIILMGCLMVGCEHDDALPTETRSEIEVRSASAPDRDLEPGWEMAHDQLTEKFLTAIRNKDLDSFMECWWNSPDAILVLENGMVVRGSDNIRAGMGMMMEVHESLDLVIDDISRFRIGGDIFCVGTATWTQTLKPEYGGGTVSFQERWTDVSRHVDGELVYTMDHAHDLTPFLQ
jgi:ketosteroid isomerase-like protein